MVHNPGRDLVIRTTIACGVLETVAVVLRMVARWRSNVTIAVDDWLLMASLIPSYAMLVNGLLMVTIGGAGRRAATLTPSELQNFLKLVSTSLVTYSLTITMVKISILLLYRRVFDTRNFKIATAVLSGVCLSWGVVAIVCLIFQCHPVSGMWTPADTFTDKCFNLKAYYSGVSGTNMALDIIILSMPIYMVWGLSLPTSQKIALSGIFLLGGLVCVASLLRIITVNFIKGVDLPYTVITPYIWSQIEPTTAIICACLTTYRPLFKGLSLRSLSALGWISSLRTKSSATDQGTITSGRASHLNETPPDDRWSKFDFSADDRQQADLRSTQELRHFQVASSAATNGGLRVYDENGHVEEQRDRQSEKGSWLESPRSTSMANSRPGSLYLDP